MTELQLALLTMFKWFHNLCAVNNLSYYALGGTMLGAVRHQGYIPWDDDIDIGMPRKDFLKLENAVKQSGQNRYAVETPWSVHDDYNYCFTKIYDTNTTLVENTKYKTRRGIYIDVFPLDGMGNTEEESLSQFRKIDRLFKFILARTTGIRKGRSSLKNGAVLVSQMIPSAIIDNKLMISRLEELCEANSFEDCAFGGNPFGAWRYKEIMPKTVMGTPTLYRFEDTVIYGAENADAYLTHLYGDWRKLPPIEKQNSHHDYLKVDLHQSYLSSDIIL